MDNLFGIKNPMIFESAPNFNIKLKMVILNYVGKKNIEKIEDFICTSDL